MTATGHVPLGWLLNQAPIVLCATVLTVFGILSPSFLAPANLLNILVQASGTAIVAAGMTFVLLTAGVDLSVGSIMFVAAAMGGKLLLEHDWPPFAVVGAIAGLGALCGLLNACLIAKLGIIAFIATLGTQYLGRGFGMWLTETRAMNLPDAFTQLASRRLLGIPLPLLVLGLVALVAHLALTRTPFGRQVHAVGQDREAARRAGAKVSRILVWVYVIGGACAGLGGAVALAQIGAVAPTFGAGKEFAAIAAAVLGGTSLFGGRGQILPGTVLGAVLIQGVENGLNNLDANPYSYPLVTSGIIFVAVLVDSLRSQWLARRRRRRIRPD